MYAAKKEGTSRIGGLGLMTRHHKNLIGCCNAGCACAMAAAALGVHTVLSPLTERAYGIWNAPLRDKPIILITGLWTMYQEL